MFAYFRHVFFLEQFPFLFWSILKIYKSIFLTYFSALKPQPYSQSYGYLKSVTQRIRNHLINVSLLRGWNERAHFDFRQQDCPPCQRRLAIVHKIEHADSATPPPTRVPGHYIIIVRHERHGRTNVIRSRYPQIIPRCCRPRTDRAHHFLRVTRSPQSTRRRPNRRLNVSLLFFTRIDRRVRTQRKYAVSSWPREHRRKNEPMHNYCVRRPTGVGNFPIKI